MTPRLWITWYRDTVDAWWMEHTGQETGLTGDSPWSAIRSYIDDIVGHHRVSHHEPAPAWLALAIRDIPTIPLA